MVVGTNGYSMIVSFIICEHPSLTGCLRLGNAPLCPLFMIFKKTLRRDFSSLAGIVFTTLFTIMVTTTLIRLLGRAAGGVVDTASVMPLIAFSAINFLPVVLVLTLFLAILMALTRAFRDSEMVIWFASGQSLLSVLPSVLRFALPFALLVGALGFVIAPWANLQSSEFKQRFAQREDISQISAGQFRESASANRVFFVESMNEEHNSVTNVFVTQESANGTVVVVAKAGQIENSANGDRFLVLEQGRRYDGVKGKPEFRLTEFERYGIRLEPKQVSLNDDSAKVKSTWELVQTPTVRHLAELHWRISLPISALILAVLAIPLASFNPRAGRSINLILAALFYVLYNNLLSLTQAWIAQGRVSFAIGVWVVHLLALALGVFLFYRKLVLYTAFAWWRRNWRIKRRANSLQSA
jgi:lipopolysaccharide export system permease protein